MCMPAVVMLAGCEERRSSPLPPTAEAVGTTSRESVQRVTFASADRENPIRISGDLRIPDNAAKPAPAVVIMHGSSGPDGRLKYHAEALNAAGIATLVADYFQPRGYSGGTGSRPSSPTVNYPDAYGALQFLAEHPDIDPKRIGIMGFSWGGVIALKTAQAAITDQMSDGEIFAAHVAFYPVCWAFGPGGPGHAEAVKPWTGAPVLIVAGGRDDYDERESCPQFAASLPEANRSLVSVKVYPDATHGFDHQGRDVTFHDPRAARGRGGEVRFYRDPAAARDARETSVQFFRTAFGL